jgi:hypothetical protein
VAAEVPLASVHLSAVSCLAPFTDLGGVVMMALTGSYPEGGGRLVRYRPDPFASLVIARSLIAAMPPGRDRDALLSRLLAVSDNSATPLAGLRAIPAAGLDPPERVLLRLLENRDPARFARLCRACPGPHERASRSSRRSRALPTTTSRSRSHRPAHDTYFPLVQYPPFLHVAPDVHPIVTSILGHAVPHASRGNLGGLARLDGVPQCGRCEPSRRRSR